MRVASFCICLLLASTLAACIPVPRGDGFLDIKFMTKDELSSYSEEIFRWQNRVMTRMMMASSMDEKVPESVVRRIEKAESRMFEACASLNEIAAARSIDDDDVGLELKNNVRTSVRSCARSTRRLEVLLDAHDIGSKTPGQSHLSESAPDPGRR